MLHLDTSDEAIVMNAPLFTGVERTSVLDLIEPSRITNRSEGGQIFCQGDSADRFFLILDGRVSLYALAENGDKTIIGNLNKGQSFAEAAIFSNMSFPVNAEAAPGTRLLEIPAQPFLKRLAERQGLAAKLLASLARWQRQLLNEVADLKNRTPAQRFGLFLLAQAQNSQDGQEISLSLTKKDLASRIGVTPESLSRIMQRFKSLGITIQGTHFIISDSAALRRFCSND